MGAKTEPKEEKKRNKIIWFILIVLSVGIVFLSLWYYSGLIVLEGDTAVSNLEGSIWNDFTGCS
uniref:Uncharacterized protein n=1 Tax=viral metagenome TaxID=1070528 RepID=A0A6C0BCI5_9ZZZZ